MKINTVLLLHSFLLLLYLFSEVFVGGLAEKAQTGWEDLQIVNNTPIFVFAWINRRIMC